MKSLFGVGAALAGCLLTFTQASWAQNSGDEPADLAYFSATLLGQEVKGGDEDAVGDFSAEANLTTGQLCYMLEVDGISDATTGQLVPSSKNAAAGSAIPLEIATSDTLDDICITADTALLKKIAKRPTAYVVEVMSTSMPNGAMRGKLED